MFLGLSFFYTRFYAWIRIVHSIFQYNYMRWRFGFGFAEQLFTWIRICELGIWLHHLRILPRRSRTFSFPLFSYWDTGRESRESASIRQLSLIHGEIGGAAVTKLLLLHEGATNRNKRSGCKLWSDSINVIEVWNKVGWNALSLECLTRLRRRRRRRRRRAFQHASNR